MKQWTKILYVSIFSILIFTTSAKAGYENYLMQKEFKTKVFSLIKSNDFERLKQYLDSVPDCDYSQQLQSPIICTLDRIDRKGFITHIWQRGFKKKEYDNFITVSIDASIYEALESLYLNLYGNLPAKLNIHNYKNFYNRFRNTWLSENAEKILIGIWQKGSFMNKYTNFDSMTGESIFTTLYLSKELELDNIFKYVSGEIAMDINSFNYRNKRLYSILKEMERKSKLLNSKELLAKVLNSWFNSIITPESWDKTEQEFYEGKKQKCMYTTLNEKGWEFFASNFVPTDWQKHVITLNVKSCRRVLKDEKVCSAFEEGAKKYGFYKAPQTEQAKQIIEEKFNEIQDQMQGKILDDLLAYK